MRLSLGLVAAIAACAAPVGAQAATVRGKLKSLPAPAKRFSATARAVDADTALVLSDQQIRSGRRYRLTVPSGPLIVAADALPTSGHALHGASGLVVAGGKGPDRANVPLGRAAKAGGGPVYRLGSVPIDAASGARIPDLDIAPLVLRLLLDDCDGTATRFVDDSGFVRRRLEHEQRLSDKGQTEVRLHYKPLAAGFEVHGHGTAGKNGSFALDLQLVDLTTKLVVAHSSVHGTFAHADALVEQAAAKLAGSDCTPPGPDAEPTPTPTPVPTPLPTATPVPTQTAEPTSAPTATPSPTAGPGSCPNGAGLQSAADASQTVTLGAGCVIKPTQPIVVAPGKTLTIVAADGAKIDGQHVTQLFRVSAGATLDVTGLVLQSGQAEGASGGHVQPADPADPGEPGTNGAPGDEGQPGAKGGPATNGEDAELSAPAIDGGDGRGGAIEDAGTLACHDCTFSGNEADGGTGGDGTDARMGGHGGDGGGGGNGGYGRPGARGGDGGSGGDGGEGAKGTDGGDGGAGLGGALYVAPGASAQLSGSSFTGNSVYGGPGGRGAAGGFGGEGGQGGIGGVGGGGHVGNFGTGGAGAAGGNGGTGGNGGKGGDGGDGGSGGPGEGGAIFNDGGTLTITGGAFTGNTAYGLYGGHGGFAGRGGGVADNENGGGAGRLGGYGGYGGCPDDNLNCGAAGGPGGDGGNGGHGGDAGSTGNGGANGDGGDGVGGAIFSTVALAPAGTTFMSNFVAAGFAHGNGCENTGAIDCPGTADYFGLGGDGGPAGAGQQGGPGAGGGPMGAHGHDGVKGADGEDGEEGETGDFGTAGVAADADIHAPSPRAEPGPRVALH